LLFDADVPKEKHSFFNQVKQLDPIGALLFVPSMISLILALQWGGSVEFPWSSPRVIGLLVTFAVLFAAFAAVQVKMPETAMAPMRIVLNRSVGSCMLFMLLNSGSLMCVAYYITIWFQAAQDTSAMQAGIRSLPLVLGLTVMGIIVAVFTQKVGYYVPGLLLSPVLSSAGAGMLSTLIPASGPATWIGYQALFGLGVGAGFQTSNLPAQSVLPRADVPLGVSMMFFSQQLGGAVFLSVAQNIFTSQLVSKLSGVAGLDPQVIVNTGATEIRRVVPPDEVDAVVGAYNFALTRVFILSAALSAVTIFAAAAVKWKNIKKPTKTKEGHNVAKNADEAAIDTVSAAAIEKQEHGLAKGLEEVGGGAQRRDRDEGIKAAKEMS
jgi:hypothetical protein